MNFARFLEIFSNFPISLNWKKKKKKTLFFDIKKKKKKMKKKKKKNENPKKITKKKKKKWQRHILKLSIMKIVNGCFSLF